MKTTMGYQQKEDVLINRLQKVTTVLLLAILLLLTAAVLQAEDKKQEDARIRKMLKKMDELYRSDSSTATLEMAITTPHWKRTLKMTFWSQGMDKTFIRILTPKKERGISTLRVSNEMWNFLPKTNKTMKIPPSLMMGSWMGSDFTNDDLVKEYTFLEDYSFEVTTVADETPGMIYVKCTPKPGRPIVWGWIVLAVREADMMPHWYKYYDEKGKLMREILYKEETDFGGRKIPAVMELIPTNKKGNKTVIRYIEATFDKKMDKSIFSLRNLRSRF